MSSKKKPTAERIDRESLERIRDLAETSEQKIQERIAANQTAALERFTAKLAALKKAKSELLKEYNQEIKAYEALIESLSAKGDEKAPQKPPAKRKTSRKKNK